MPPTRNSASRAKAKRETLITLCTNIITKSGEQDFFDNGPEVVSAYVKLVELRNELTAMREYDDTLPETAEDFVKVEELDQRCILTAEKLYDAIPAGHALRKREPPLHLDHIEMEERGDGDGSARPAPQKKRTKKPDVPEFDGKNMTWAWWKVVFDK